MFDSVEISVRSGNGGDGAIGFRREKFVPFGGPDGGDGGNGGSVIIRTDRHLDSLVKYRQKRSFKAERGINGGKARKHGRNGEDVVITVPPGTVVTDRSIEGTGTFLADLSNEGEEVVVARGGSGGWGNVHFATSTNQAPHIAQRGEAGEEKRIRLEMRLIADVGIIGCPNAGKSTLLASASAARPKVDSYPFTTIEPVPGVVEVGQERFIMVEIPGLIEGAHLGKGLGHEFLRHIIRTRILIHLLNGNEEKPLEDMMKVNDEIVSYDPLLARKPQIVALNKIDLPEVRQRLTGIRKEIKNAGIKAFYISAETGEGVAELMAEAAGKLKVRESVRETADAEKVKTFRPQPKEGLGVSREGDTFILHAPGMERLIFGTGVSQHEMRWQMRSQLSRIGAEKALEKAGIKPGDKVRCGEVEWEW